MADIDKENLEKAISGSGSQNNQNSQQQNPQQSQQQTSQQQNLQQGQPQEKQMSKEMEIGFHQGALNTLNKERGELLKMAQNVESIMQMHAQRLKELGVNIQFQNQGQQQEQQEQQFKDQGQQGNQQNSQQNQ